MSNQLEKLKNSIKLEYVNQFELNLMKTSGFIPVDKRQNNFYVIINKKNANEKDSISSIIQEKLGDIVPQFIPLNSNDFHNILNEINPSNQQNNSTNAGENNSEANDKNKQELSAEEMLVGIGWLTEEQ